jgi:hypothetical protein
VVASIKVVATSSAATASVSLTCDTATCSGSAQLVETIVTKSTVKEKVGGKTVTKTVSKSTTVVLASATYKLSKGKSTTTNLTLTASGRSLLKTASTKSPLHESLVTTVKGGSSTTKSVTLT